MPELPVVAALTSAVRSWPDWRRYPCSRSPAPCIRWRRRPDSAANACPRAVSSFEIVVWSLETCCSSEETVWRAASQVAWPAWVPVLALVHSFWAWTRSACFLFWSVDKVDSSWVSVV